jgi:ATP-binding cassette subfamily B protein
LTFIRKKLRNAFAQLPYLPRAFGLVWQAARGWTMLWLVLLIIQGLLPAAAVLLLRAVVDEMVAVVGSGGAWVVMRPVLALGALLGLVLLLQEVTRGTANWVRTAQGLLVEDHIAALVHRQSVALDLGFYDSPGYYDHLHRARNDARHRPTALLESAGALLQSSITLIAMAAVLATYGWWVPVVLVVSTAPALFVVLRYTVREHDWQVRTTADQRKSWYYDHLLTAREVAAELRSFDLGGHFIDRFQTLRERLRNERLAIIRSQALSAFTAGLLGLLAMAGVMVWMIGRAAQGGAGLGDMVLFYQAFTQGQGLMRTLLENIGQIYRNLLFIGNLFEFLSLQPQVVDAARPTTIEFPLQQGIRFRDVHFSYPETDRTVFHGFNLDIPAGRIVSIVGANGAGKSTLIKLLCRFYDPQSGAVELDGVDLRGIPLANLRSAISVLFQQPVPYQDTVSENIALGALQARRDTPRIEAAARNAGAQAIIDKLPGRYDTRLGKWFEGGTDLSVGEWQRMGLARAFMSQASIMVLDEPTSAMDPWAEADWLQRFRGLATGKTVIIISHRFTTAMIADVIHVMDDGQIIESGCHRDLLTLNGRYAESWRAQTG